MGEKDQLNTQHPDPLADQTTQSSTTNEAIPPIQTPTSNQISTKPPHKGMGKLTKILIGLVVLILLAIIGFLAFQNYQFKSQMQKPAPTPLPTQTPPSPTPDPTADWETYQDPQNLLTFKYPPTWDAQKLEIAGGNGVVSLSNPEIINPEPGIGDWVMNIQYYKNPEELSLKEYQVSIKDQRTNAPVFYDESAPTRNIGGIQSLFLQNQSCEPAACHRYLIPYKDKIFEISIFYKNLNQDDDTKVDQILSTFKFLDNNSTTSCSSDQDCPATHFCDSSYTGEGMDSSNYLTDQTYGSEKCIQRCVSDSDCESNNCIDYEIRYGDAISTLKGCKI